MTRDDLFCLHEETCANALVTMKKKNHDYAESSDPFQNFRGSEVFSVPPVIGILLRVQDKMQRINTFARKGALLTKSESVYDAIEDVINYMVLIKGLIVEEEKNARTKSATRTATAGTTSGGAASGDNTVEHSGVSGLQTYILATVPTR